MGARASTEDRDLGLDVLDIIVGRFEIDLREGSPSAVVLLAQRIRSYAATYMFDGDYLARGLLDALVDDSKTAACTIQVLVAKAEETEATGGRGMRTAKLLEDLVLASKSLVRHVENPRAVAPLIARITRAGAKRRRRRGWTGPAINNRVGVDARAQGPRQSRGSQQERSPLTHGQGDNRGVRSNNARVVEVVA